MQNPPTRLRIALTKQGRSGIAGDGASGKEAFKALQGHRMTNTAAVLPKSVSAAAADSDDLDTFPKMLLAHARLRGARPAMREKDYGIWQSWTWGDVAREVEALAGGLAGLGFRRGDKL